MLVGYKQVAVLDTNYGFEKFRRINSLVILRSSKFGFIRIFGTNGILSTQSP